MGTLWLGGPGSGGARRDRTANLLHAMQALSQLSYSPSREARPFNGHATALSTAGPKKGGAPGSWGIAGAFSSPCSAVLARLLPARAPLPSPRLRSAPPPIAIPARA